MLDRIDYKLVNVIEMCDKTNFIISSEKTWFFMWNKQIFILLIFMHNLRAFSCTLKAFYKIRKRKFMLFTAEINKEKHKNKNP